jgi:hypothetical protein
LNDRSPKGLNIFWIAVRPSTVDDTEIAKYQAVHKDPPLALIEEAQREAQFLHIYKKIKEAVEA